MVSEGGAGTTTTEVTAASYIAKLPSSQIAARDSSLALAWRYCVFSECSRAAISALKQYRAFAAATGSIVPYRVRSDSERRWRPASTSHLPGRNTLAVSRGQGVRG
jgi:hypothetical protein